MQKQAMPTQSKKITFKKGKSIFTVDFGQKENEEKPTFSFKEFKLVKMLDKNSHIEGIEILESSQLAEIYDVNFPNMPIKTDISTGFFLSKKKAAKEFISAYTFILKSAKSEYNYLNNELFSI